MKNIEALFPALPAQELALLAGDAGSTGRCGQLTLPLEGALDVVTLAAAWRGVVGEETALRTSFVWRRVERPLQVVHREVETALEEVNWRSDPSEGPEERLELWLAADRERGFDLARPPLARLTLCRMGPDRTVLVCTYHRLALDAWSARLVLQRLLDDYRGRRHGRAARRPEDGASYRDYMAWLKRQNLEEAEAFWRRSLEGSRGVALPDGSPVAGAAGATSPRPARREKILPSGLEAALRRLARQQGLCWESLLDAAWALVLHRYTRERDLVFGISTPGRPDALAGASLLVGPFAADLPLRVLVPEAGEILPWLRELRDRRAAVTRFPFAAPEQIRAWSGLTDDNPLLTSSIEVEEHDPDDLLFFEENGLRAGRIERTGERRPPLVLRMTSRPALALRLDYDPRRLDEAVVEGMLGLLAAIFERIAGDPTVRLEDLPRVAPADLDRLARWNRTATGYPRERTIHGLFEEQAALRPEDLAIEFDVSLTYRELNRRANRLARRLRSSGIRPEAGVGLFLERSADLVVGMLAVLKAGGIYVPLDISYPPERLAFLLEDSAVPVVLTWRGLRGALPEHHADVIELDGDPQALGEHADTDPESWTGPGHTAYVIYTSGSTGRPKGVAVPHRAVVRLVRDTDYAQLRPDDVVAQASNASFDAATFEIWGALLNGARLRGISRDVSLSPSDFAESLRTGGVTTLFLTTALFNQIAREVPRAFGTLRHVLFGGEAVDPRRVREILTGGAPPRRLLHVYGPTETTTFASWQPVIEVAEEAWTIPIGGPIANTTLHLVDAGLDPVPLEVAGELCIGGDGLAWGYAGRPELTAERFVPDPLSGEPGARLYRTGDLGRRRPDGTVEFLGRRDNQVKLRGFRIELEEIEAALSQLPGVAGAVVLVREERPGDKRLVAYVVPAAGGVSAASLRTDLQRKLPEYMVPSAFVLLEGLPLTSNGKVDRRALPPPPPEGAEEGSEAPRTPVEEVVGAIWATVLGREQVGLHEDFFELGGHSLLATQVISRVRETFRVEIPLRSLFEEPTVAGLAAVVESALQESQNLAVPPIGRLSRGGEIPLSFAQQRLWFLDRLEPGSAAYNMPLAFRLEGRLELPALAASLTEVVRRHESLRTTFGEIEGAPVQRTSPPAPIPLPVVDLWSLPAAARQGEALRLAACEARRPFDLELGPVLRATILRVAGDEQVILLTLHHIVGDGWSLGILVREVTALYRAFTGGAPATLPELPVQYADFSIWQRTWLEGAILERELEYWRRQLAGLPPVLELPTDRPRPAVQRYRGGSVVLDLGKGLSREIQAASRREASTPFMTLLAAFQLLLYRSSRQPDVCVGTPIAGRTHLELEDLIGFFVNTLVLRARCSSSLRFHELWGQVRETVLGAYVHQHVPFERLVNELQPERSLSYSPLFQVMLSLQNAPVPDLDLPGARLRSLGGTGAGTSQFDLSLDAGEAGGRFVLALTYDADLFDRVTAIRMLRHLETLLAGVMAEPWTRLLEAPLLTAAERHQTVTEWNDSQVERPWEASYQLLFEAQAERSPERVAAVCAGEGLTYRELNRRANRVAWRLISLGCQPDQIVPLLAERGLSFLSAVLGILKAGGAYLPLEPRHPAQRWARVLEGARVPFAVVSRDLASPLEEALGLVTAALRPRAVALEALLEPGESEDNPPCRVTPEHLGYSIFTSGSTGLPKGPMVQHRGMLNHIWALVQDLALSSRDRVAQTASQCFDISVWQLLAMPLLGGTVCILPDEVAQDGGRLLAAVEREGITVLEIVPSLMRVMLEERAARPERPGLAALRWLIPTGEALPPDLARQWLSELPGVPLVNAYGPAECADDVSYSFLHGGDPVGQVTIGRPIGNVRLHVVDEDLHEVPIGAPGELCAGGLCVGRGYLNDPARTAEAFVPDPFAAEPGVRCYRTGDLVRSLPDGSLGFLGRIDHQVKIRGFRIEPGEIETALAAHPGVREAVVLARENAMADRRLVAYTVPSGEPPVTAAELREALRRTLPDYMVPAFFVFLPALPLSANGKLDRRALPPPEAGPVEEGRYAPPRTPAEEMLAEIWGEVLGLDRVDRAGHFFEIGGHSLLATRVVSRVRETFGVEIPLRALFEAPTLAALALRIEAERREAAGARVPPLMPVPREGRLPLSFAQERLWFLDQLEPGSSAYNMAMAYRFRGQLDIAALSAALETLERRHEVLRTRYEAERGQPFQVVMAPRLQIRPVIDLTILPGEERERELRRLARDEARRPFDLRQGPVLRASVVRLMAEDYALFFTVHHIACDGWSQDILAQEVSALYQAYATGRPSPLPELPVQYADYAAWQRSWLQGEVLEAQVAFWRMLLAGAPPVLELPADRSRPAIQSFRGSTLASSLEPAVARELASRSRSEDVTTFMLLLTAFQVLLARYSGQGDIVVGTPVAGRDRLETERLIGFFVNTLALRSPLAAEEPFSAVLRANRDRLLDVYAHQDLPFERLVDELGGERSLSHTPIFQVMFTHQNAPAAEAGVAGLNLTPLAAETGMVQFDLTLATVELADGLVLTFRYGADLFDRSTVERMAGHFQTLLASVANGADAPLAELPLLSAAERTELLSGWNATAVAWPRETLIHELIERRVAICPEARAVGCGAERLSYGELEARANRLARHLRRLGVGPEVLVGLCVERSAAMVVALLGILKAGGAYVPLDPSHPAERLGLVLADSAMTVLVSEERLLDRLPEHATKVVCLDRDAAVIAQESARPLERIADAETLAYVLYTSGSTGRPKGVGLPHRAVVNFLRAMAARPGVGERDVVPALTTLSFDIAGLEIYLPLVVGGRVEVLGHEKAADGALLAGSLVEVGATVVQATPATWRLLLDTGWKGIPGLKVLCGGEVLPRDLAAALLARGVELWNVYGPTETAIWSAAGEVAADEGPVLLGRPIANTSFYIVDPGFEPVPVGVTGELLIGGEGLSRGYLYRPDLTAEKFVPHPWAGERSTAGARVYRTGDRVRYRPSGELEFLGRIDHQVKVRGFRIELGEIEAALSRQPAVRQAVVVVREEAGDKRLVAYLVADAPLPVAELRDTLRLSLPEYMIPSTFVTLEAFPLTANGKVDRKALPAPVGSAAVAETYLAPRTPEEDLLAGIWAEVLGVGRVGVRDDFFALGGHSLLATQVLSRLRETFQVELPLRKLFEAPVLEDLATAVAAARRDGSWPATPPLERVPRDGDLPLSFAQERLWFLDQLEPASPAYNIPIALRLEGELRLEILAAALGEVVRRHEGLRTVFRARDGKPVQVIRPAEAFPLPVIDLSALPAAAREETASVLAGREAMQPFDLSRGPLVRGVSLRLGADDHAVLLTLHHIISDGWSIGVLVREVVALYQSLSVEGASLLPELPVQYADYAVWQRNWLQGEVLEQEIAYWRGQLSGMPALLELPADRPRPPVQSFRGAVHPVHLPQELTEGLRALARRHGATLFMALLAGFHALLGRLSGRDDVAVGTPIAGRNHLQTEGLIGFFVNTLVQRGDLSGSPTVGDLLVRERETTLAAHLHQEVPFERLVQELSPERNLSYSPLFQAMLTLQNVPAETVSAGGLRLRALGGGGATAKFDLTLALQEQGRELAGGLEYSTDLFDRSTVERMAGHLQALLASVAKGAEGLVAELPLLDAAELHQAVHGWNEGAAVPAGGTLHERFEAHAAAHPDAAAVSFGGESLSYAELDRQANRLARHLLRLGVRRGTLVGLLAERSLDLVVAVLGILKAGAAYVPLDPAHPRERLAFALEDSGVLVLLAQEGLLERVPELPSQIRLVLLDRDRPVLEQESSAPPACGVTADDLAYVIYTSGSTGRPKGVGVRHGNVLRLLRATEDWLSLGPADVWTLFHSIAFDFSVWELWGALALGGRLVVVPYWVSRSPEALLDLLRTEGVTVLNQTPSAFRQLLWADEAAGSPELALRLVIFGGEALDLPMLEPWLARRGEERPRLVNMYGITETTVHVTYRPIGLAEVRARRGSVIGRPLPDQTVYLLDRHLGPVPIGVAGEMCVGGAGNAVGYLDRPELTAERFVPDPFAGVQGARLYRSGDLARRRPDGDLEYLGRIDQQVKIRGFRIEPGEIEAVLGSHNSVRGALVLLWEPSPGDCQLAAYVVCEGPEDPDVGELRRFLQLSLPEYMIPSAFVILEAFPLTPNGKVDRKALPAPTGDRGGQESAYVPPRDALELDLVLLWEELLAVRPIGVRDSFFALGGHSLLAVRLAAGIARRLGRELPLLELFQHPTVESLARWLRTDRPITEPVSPMVAIQAAGGRRPFFCVHPGGGTVLSYVALSRYLGQERPFYGLQNPAIQPGHEAEDTLEAMAARYVLALREVQPSGPYLLGGWSLGGVVAYEMARQLQEAGERVERLALIDAHASAERRSGGDELTLLAAFAQNLGIPLAEVPVSATEARAMSRQELLAGLAEQARRFDVLPPDVGLERIEHLFRVFVAHSQALERYAPRPYDGHLILYRATGERLESDDASLGWRGLALGGVEIREVPGDHFTVVREPAVAELAARLAEDLP